jgi:hypothetical protein
MQVAYDAAEDRLLLRVSTASSEEYRVWLTRRFTTLLLPHLVRTLEGAVATKAPEPMARREVLAFEHAEATANADFSTPFQDASTGAPRSYPLGNAPLLAFHAQIGQDGPALYRLALNPQDGQGIELKLDNRLMHSLLKLIESAMREAEWAAASQDAPPAQEAVQKAQFH